MFHDQRCQSKSHKRFDFIIRWHDCLDLLQSKEARPRRHSAAKASLSDLAESIPLGILSWSQEGRENRMFTTGGALLLTKKPPEATKMESCFWRGVGASRRSRTETGGMAVALSQVGTPDFDTSAFLYVWGPSLVGSWLEMFQSGQNYR